MYPTWDWRPTARQRPASIWKLSEESRHKSLDTLRGYVRRVDLFKDHTGAGFLLAAHGETRTQSRTTDWDAYGLQGQ